MDPITVKLSCGQEVHRLSVSSDELNMNWFVRQVNDLFNPGSARLNSWVLLYTDDEGEEITVSMEHEIEEACRVQYRMNENSNAPLRFRVGTPRPTWSASQFSMEPLIHAMQELSARVSRLAENTRDSFRSSVYVERGRESLAASSVQTRRAFTNAGARLRQASSVVAGEISGLRRRTRNGSRDGSVDEKESFLGDKSGATESEDETWEKLGAAPAHAESKPAETVEAKDQVEEDTASDDLNVQIGTIRAIAPDVEVARCRELLEKHNGNVEAVLVELTDK